MKVKVISLPSIFQVLYVLCFTWTRYQVSVYRTIGPLVCSNDDPAVTMTHFTARSNLVTYAFLWGKMKTVNFSETIAACDLKIGRCRQLIEFFEGM